MKGFAQFYEKINKINVEFLNISEKCVLKKKEVLSDFILTMVTRTGFEPVNACVKGM